MRSRLKSVVFAVALALVASSSLAFPAYASAPGQATASANKICPGVTREGRIPAPAKGFASFVESVVLADCSVVDGPVRTIRLSDVPNFPATPEEAALQHNRHLAGDPTLTQFTRSWDACPPGCILMNELDTTLQWQAIYGGAYPYNQYNTTSYHTEAWPSRGWWLDYQQLWYSAGCSGCSYDQVTGTAGFGYQGVFDPTGTLFYNKYQNWVTGYGAGYGTCRYWYSWRNSIIGWHIQQWCG